MAIQFVIIHNGTGYDVSNMFEEITWSGIDDYFCMLQLSAKNVAKAGT